MVAIATNGEKAHSADELAELFDNADHAILRIVVADKVGNSDLKDAYLSGIDHNLVVAALRAYRC